MSNLPATTAEESQKTDHNCREQIMLLTKLPRVKSLSSCIELYQYQGFWYPLKILEALIPLQKHFQARSTDIFLCAPLKAGFTWLKALAFAIETRTTRFVDNDDSLAGTNPLLTKLPHDLVPFLEHLDLTNNIKSRDPQLPLLATHFPYTALPESVTSSGCKIIYICREPKDNFVSYWHFFKTILQNKMNSSSFENEFELFCQGKSSRGPYWDHVLAFWRASIEKPGTVLFLKYEELTTNTLFWVRKMAEFTGKPFSEEEEMEQVPQRIVELCSFENLSNLEVNKNGKIQSFRTTIEVDNSAFFRKGIIGDWKNHLTDEMKEAMDQITKQKLLGSNLVFGIPK
ncbi:hypothetical protein ACH5RR_034321 [Cinchona calisaya]|uniref:Sulfotransferase n=1 Tax=Cinchona calisaya TaxID=153742 RepID=A0ABD2YE68_9GENT